MGLVRRELPVSDGIKEQANVQRGLYQITDNFFCSWYAFVFPNISELEAGDVDGIYEYAIQPMLEQYTSRIYEDACREYLRRLNRQNALPFRFTRIGRWWNKGAELDIMTTDRDKNHFILGECKFKNAAFDLAELKATLANSSPRKRRRKCIAIYFPKAASLGMLIRLTGIPSYSLSVPFERLRESREPVYGVICMLKQAGRLLVDQTVGLSICILGCCHINHS